LSTVTIFLDGGNNIFPLFMEVYLAHMKLHLFKV
jgi:hypothetical protein